VNSGYPCPDDGTGSGTGTGSGSGSDNGSGGNGSGEGSGSDDPIVDEPTGCHAGGDSLGALALLGLGALRTRRRRP
jgi:MYXO-CTERM domain-containing protein